jgi:hypothetical protein
LGGRGVLGDDNVDEESGVSEIYLQARVQLKYGKLGEFMKQMETIVPMLESKGWKLIGSWHTLVGNLAEVVDLWEVDDANHVAMEIIDQVNGVDQAFSAAYPALFDLIDVETLSLMRKTTFSP